MTTDEISSLRYYVAHLVRVWTALRIIRGGRSSELIRVFQDVCSDKLRNMLHELATKKRWTLGFSADGTARQKQLFRRLVEANKWFEGYTNRLHSRNVSGAHLQPMEKADHMFQMFGYGGEREWKQLTRGVAACIALMKLLDGKPNPDFWRRIRLRVMGRVDDSISATIQGKKVKLDIPIGVEALLQSYKLASTQPIAVRASGRRSSESETEKKEGH